MAKVWVLDTGTKGTGASVVPLESTLVDPARGDALPYVPRKREPRPPKAPEPRQPRRFKLVEVVSGAVLAEDADTRATLDVLRDLRSIVDVHVYVWQPGTESWRRLTLGEQKTLWRFRKPAAPETMV